MSLEQAQAFLEKVKNDEDLIKKLEEAQDKDAKLEIARQEGFEFTVEEIQETKDRLSDEELKNAAGGTSSNEQKLQGSQDCKYFLEGAFAC